MNSGCLGALPAADMAVVRGRSCYPEGAGTLMFQVELPGLFCHRLGGRVGVLQQLVVFLWMCIPQRLQRLSPLAWWEFGEAV